MYMYMDVGTIKRERVGFVMLAVCLLHAPYQYKRFQKAKNA